MRVSKRNRGRRGETLFSRLVLTHVLVAVVTLVIVVLAALSLTRGYLSASLNRELDAHVLAFREGPAAAVHTPGDLAPVARTWFATRPVPEDQVIVLRAATGETVATSGGLDLSEVSGGDRLFEAETPRRWRVETAYGAVSGITVPLLLEQQPVGTFIAAGSEAEATALLRGLARQMGWAALAGLAFAAWLGSAATRRTAHPRSASTHPLEAIEEADEPFLVGAADVWQGELEPGERWLKWQALGKHAAIVAELAMIFALVFALKFSLGALVVKRFRVWSDSMVPTLVMGQQLLVDRLSLAFDRPDRGDIVVFTPPAGAASNRCGIRRAHDQACPLPTTRRSDTLFIKRVVGLPGDRLKILRGVVYINGEPQTDHTVHVDPDCGVCNLPTEITVPPGHYFVLGDNRAYSDDSRYWGPIAEDWLIGRAFFSFWPPSRFGPT